MGCLLPHLEVSNPSFAFNPSCGSPLIIACLVHIKIGCFGPLAEQKEKLSEVEQQLKKAEAAQRRKLQMDKAARESEVGLFFSYSN